MNENIVCVNQTKYFSYTKKFPFESIENDGDNYLNTEIKNILKIFIKNHHNNKYFGKYIDSCKNIVIKPNLVKEGNLKNKKEWESVITHPSIVKAVIDLLIMSLKKETNIIVADAPQADSSWEKIMERTKLDKLIEYYNKNYPQHNFKLIDLRKEEQIIKNNIVLKRKKLKGDPMGYSEINLGKKSLFENKKIKTKYYGADYDYIELNKNHKYNIHKYLISNTILNADFIINIPKLKTHKKAGVTLSLKNFIGAIGDKNFLPHYTMGTPDADGDEFEKSNFNSKLEGKLIKYYYRLLDITPDPINLLSYFNLIGKKMFGETDVHTRSGNWYGNDTIWRTIIDINRIIYYYKYNKWTKNKNKIIFNMIDGIIAGEGNGPMSPDEKKLGVLIAGFDPFITDYVTSKIIGFNTNYIPIFKYNLYNKKDELKLVNGNLEKINVAYINRDKIKYDKPMKLYNFKPHFGWKLLLNNNQ